MKFKIGDSVFYVDPFMFIISRVYIRHFQEISDGVYYIDQTNAYLYEDDVFENINDAKDNALSKLRNFYVKKEKEIYETPEEGYNYGNAYGD